MRIADACAWVAVVCLIATQTNLVPLSALIIPLVAGWMVFAGRIPLHLPTWWGWLALMLVWQVVFTLIYDPSSLVVYEFYRYDFHGLISWGWMLVVPILRPHGLSPRRVATCFALGTGPLLGLLLLYYLVTVRGDTFGGLFYARNAFGGWLAILGCVCVAMLFTDDGRLQPRRARYWWWLLLAVVVLSLLLTRSRGSLIGLLVTCAWCVTARLLPGAFRARMLALLLLGMAGVSMAAGWFFYERYGCDGEQTVAVEDDGKTNNIYIRTSRLWPQAHAIWRSSPLIGRGFGTFNDEYSNILSIGWVTAVVHPGVEAVNHHDGHAHNSYLHVLAEQGLFGLAIFIVIYVSMYRWLRRHRPDGDGFGTRMVFLCLMCLGAMSLTENRFTTPSNALPAAILIALAMTNRHAVGVSPVTIVPAGDGAPPASATAASPI